jgi:Polyketide cyclase / dehydrase and lipid transport
MRADTKSVSIDATPAKVFQFLADPQNLPRWAVGFAQAIRPDGSGWVVTTSGGPIALQIDADGRHGVVDYHLSPAPGVEWLAASRVVARGKGSEYMFTQFQASAMPDATFEQSIRTLAHELVVLKALLEVECPL